MLKTRPLCTGVESNLGDRVLGEAEKNSFIALPGKGWVSRLMLLELCPSRIGGIVAVVRSFTALVRGWNCWQGSGCVQGLPSFNLASGGLLMSSVWSNCDLLSGLKNASSSYHLPFVRGFSSAEEHRDAVMCVSWGGARTEPWECTVVSWLLLPYLCIPQTPASLVSNSLNPPLWTQGESWRLKLVSYKQEMGDTEKLPYPGAPQGLVSFKLYQLRLVAPSVQQCLRTHL